MTKRKNKILILFPDDWLSYSPTIINLAEILNEDGFEVTIIAVAKNKQISNAIHQNVKLLYVEDSISLFIKFLNKIENLILKVSKLLNRLCNKTVFDEELWCPKNVIKLIRSIKIFFRTKEVLYNILFAVDNVGFFIGTRLLKRKTHFISLELNKNIFYYLIDWGYMESLIIQNVERQNYLLPESVNTKSVFFIQNSPRYSEEIQTSRSGCNRLIYFGYPGLEYNGIINILETLKLLPNEYSITFKGPFNLALFNYVQEHFRNEVGQRIIIDNSYLLQKDIPKYLNNFDIGFTFYLTNSLEKDFFNVISCPSGKLFNFYNAGIPVIGNDILGLSSVKIYNSGILISEVNSKSIYDSIIKISNHFNFYAENAKKAAYDFDFEKGTRKIISFLDNN